MNEHGKRTAMLVLTVALALAGAGCVGAGSATVPRANRSGHAALSGTGAGSSGTRGVGQSAAESSPHAGKVCPVTLPNGSPPPGAQPDPGFYGNGALWTTFWPYGVVVAAPSDVRKDGSIGMKFPWWRKVRGELSISGHRLDAPAPPLRSEFTSYGPTGFQASGIIFPTQGCWEVTGRAGTASLTFVLIVVRPDPTRLASR